MALPTPKAPSAATSTPVSAPAATPVASAPAATTGDKAKKPLAKFGVGRDNVEKGLVAVPVPNVNGTNLVDIVAALIAGLTGIPSIGTIENAQLLVAEIEKLPKSAFPGNKQGRAAWNAGNIVKGLLKIHAGLNKTRAVGEKKPRKKAVEKYQGVLEKLAAKMGGTEGLLKLLGDDFNADELTKMLERKVAKDAPAA